MKKLRKKIKKERERVVINVRVLIYNKFNINDFNK